MNDEATQKTDTESIRGTITFPVLMTQSQIDAFKMGWELAQRNEFDVVTLRKQGLFGSVATVTFTRLGVSDE